ncbi:CheR family methyltransferase [Pedobacter chitinilyticus]|uniref:Protein-glutamate O-methyltransferase CheR n=1 Tax=Pedobacter chitinilyticus TaxID=2233776 RepID=A0A3S3PU27_9SPHI|nr:protein-glutamate O-methyltransferase CheR [Pedobacter chitinilyticus]RWU07695.1 protein-glutamate O-methyltransferase CheR [Pedobacter chitinilyticus]
MSQAGVISDEQVEILINDVLEHHGYDFTGYSRASLKRRLSRLYSLDKHLSFAEFRYKTLNDDVYFKHFVEGVTVNVTEMFRDPSFYRLLRKQILPNLNTYPFIRIWLAGCSTGEEAYSIAILLKELNLLQKSLIYATDINPTVLEKASNGMFPLSQMKSYSENYIAAGGIKDFSSYYSANYNLAKFDEELKRKMIFSTHNLVSDRSFNEFQLILCRNVLIYFDRPLQFRVLQLFDQSLENLGYLALGTKETIDFSPISATYKKVGTEKVWRKVGA